MMFGKQEKDLVFLETVMGLAQQRRHCLIECLPLPREVATDAPLYFKKVIDNWHAASKYICIAVLMLSLLLCPRVPFVFDQARNHRMPTWLRNSRVCKRATALMNESIGHISSCDYV